MAAETEPLTLTLKVIDGSFAVCRLSAGSPLPAWFQPGPFASISWSEHELSIVCDEGGVPEEVQCERGWGCLMLQGPFPFEMTGVLLKVLQPLAIARIGIFAVSTFDTDYVLVKTELMENAKRVLRESGLQLLPD